jgi:hypothetical protein
MESIFGSKLKLSFKRREIEDAYTEEVNLQLSKYVKTFTICLAIFSLIPSFEVAFMFNLSAKRDFLAVTIFTFIINIVYLAMTCLVCRMRSIKFLKVINYINYFSLTFILLNSLYPLVHYVGISKVFIYGIISLEVFARMVWILLGLHGFVEGLIICVISSATAWSFYGTIAKDLSFADNVLLLITRMICMSFVVIFAYFLEKTQRKVYYYDYLNKKKTEWKENVLNKMNAGFFTLKNDEVNYINLYMKNEIKNWKQFKAISSNSKTFEQEESKYISLLV